MLNVLNFRQGIESGTIHVADLPGNIIIGLRGGIEEFAKKTAENFTIIQQEFQKLHTIKLNTDFDYFVNHLDSIYKYLNSQQTDPHSKTLNLNLITAKELETILEALIKNINSLDSLEFNEISAKMSIASQSVSGINITIDNFNALKIRLQSLHNLLEQRLANLKITNQNFADAEALAVAASGLSQTHGDFLALTSRINETSSKTDLLDSLIQQAIEDICSKIAKIKGMGTDLELLNRRLNAVDAIMGTVMEALILVNEKRDIMEAALADIENKCTELDEFMKCLILYMSSILNAGANIAIEKENKVFKINAIPPEMPDCPEIIYVEPDAKPEEVKKTTKTPTTKAPTTKAPTAPPDKTLIPETVTDTPKTTTTISTTQKAIFEPDYWISPFGITSVGKFKAGSRLSMVGQNFGSSTPQFSENRYTLKHPLIPRGFAVAIGAVNRKTGACFAGITFSNQDLDDPFFEDLIMTQKAYAKDWVDFAGHDEWAYTECEDFQPLWENFRDMVIADKKSQTNNKVHITCDSILKFSEYISNYECTPGTHSLY